MQNKLFSSIIISIICVTMSVGCSKSDPTNANHPKDTLRVDVGSETPTLDPTLAEDTASNRIMYDLFAGLVDFDQSNNVIPGMAEKWDISKDRKTYTFHLRQGLKFSDGSSITSSDFIYSWRRLVDPKTASPYSFLFSNLVNAQAIMDGKAPVNSLGVSAPDANTFIVNLVSPDPAFLPSLNLMNAGVVPQKTIAKYGNKWTDPVNIVTSGAYVVTEHIINGYIMAKKNPYYYDANNVHIEKIKYLPYEDKNATIPAYKSGGLDVTFQSIQIDQFTKLKQEYPKEMHVFTQEAMYYYDFSANNPELSKNPKLRQALSMAVDRNVLVNKVLRQEQPALYSTVTPTVENGRFKGLDYDWANWPRDKQVAEAKKLYAEAGYGPDHPYHVTISYNSNDLHKKVAMAVAAMWKQTLGVDAAMQNQEWKTFLQTRHKGDYQIARDGWVADYNSVNTYIALYQCNNGQNNSHWCNPEFDKLVAQANVEDDVDKQTDLYKQALLIPLNDYAIIPLFQYTVSMLVKPYVTGYTPDTNHLYHTQSKWMSFSK